MKNTKFSKKFVKLSVIFVVVFIVLSIILNGITIVPYKYRNKPISFLTQNLTWDSRPSDIILKYGLPKYISKVSDITGERNFNFKFVYNGKDVDLSISNSYSPNVAPHRYYFTINCETPEKASTFFDECHENMMALYQNEPDFELRSNIETEYKHTDGTLCRYTTTHENGVEKIYIIDENSNEIPIEEADNVIKMEKKEHNYNMLNTTGMLYSLVYHGGDYITLCAEIMY